MQQKSLKLPNEFTKDFDWQQERFDHLLYPVLDGEVKRIGGHLVVYTNINSAFGSHIQRCAHIDLTAQVYPHDPIPIEIKIVRWPHDKDGRPWTRPYKAFFLETWSCTNAGHRSKGWMATSMAEIILYCQCSLDENRLRCYPLPFQKLKIWAREHYDDLPTSRVPNPINGRCLWTEGRIAEISKVRDALHVEGFRLDQDGLVTDLLGRNQIQFLRR